MREQARSMIATAILCLELTGDSAETGVFRIFRIREILSSVVIYPPLRIEDRPQRTGMWFGCFAHETLILLMTARRWRIGG